jgi:hypothetical protein
MEFYCFLVVFLILSPVSHTAHNTLIASTSEGIQKHFVVVKIQEFDAPNPLFWSSYVPFSRDGIHKTNDQELTQLKILKYIVDDYRTRVIIGPPPEIQSTAVL